MDVEARGGGGVLFGFAGGHVTVGVREEFFEIGEAIAVGVRAGGRIEAEGAFDEVGDTVVVRVLLVRGIGEGEGGLLDGGGSAIGEGVGFEGGVCVEREGSGVFRELSGWAGAEVDGAGSGAGS